MNLRIVSLVLVAALSAGCSGGETPESQSDREVPDVLVPEDEASPGSAEAVPLASHTFSPSDCTDPRFPEPLSVTTDVLDEVGYLDDIVACGDRAGTRVWLSNDSVAVWDVYRGTEKLSVPTEPGPFKVMFEVEAFTPGNKITFAAGEQLEWHVNYDLSARHVAFELMLDELKSHGAKVVADALDRRTPTGAAVVRCGFAFSELASGEPADDEGAVAVMDGVFEAAAVGARCREAMDRLSLPDDAGRRTSALDALRRRSAQTAVIEEVSGKLSYAKTASQFLRFAVQIR